MDNLLIFINPLGQSYDGQYLYEFMFSDSIEDVDGEDWDISPASGLPQPPSEYAKLVKTLKTEIKIDLIQNSDTFSLWDSVDGVIALGWEDVMVYEEYPDFRLCFKYGETLESINKQLYQKELMWHGIEIKVKHGN